MSRVTNRARRVSDLETGEYYWVLRDEFGTTRDGRICSDCGQLMNPGDDMRRIVVKMNGELIRTHTCSFCYSTYK